MTTASNEKSTVLIDRDLFKTLKDSARLVGRTTTGFAEEIIREKLGIPSPAMESSKTRKPSK